MVGSKSRECLKSDNTTKTGHEGQTAPLGNSLDLFSTSPTSVLSEDSLGYSPNVCASEKCIYHAPYFALNEHGAVWRVIQGCCNHWDCPRCGKERARQEYGRIVNGCRILAEKHELFFITITCRGKELTKNEADDNYGLWTNKLLDSWRLQAKRKGKRAWNYVQVTERQARGHPHSHIITTWSPDDLYMGTKKQTVWEGVTARVAYVPALRSEYIARSVVRSGLGSQYDITTVKSVEGASRYVAKYMFKDSIFNTVWPENWRRVRYSQSFPKLTREKSKAYVLLTDDDWRRLAHDAIMVKPNTPQAMDECQRMLRGSDVILSAKLTK